MPSIGPMEMIIVLAIALLVLGPKRLPQVGRQLGSGMREFKGAITGGTEKLTAHYDEDDQDEDHTTHTRRETVTTPA